MAQANRNERRRELTRGKLLAGALEVIAEKGVEETAIREITEAADVASGSFYTYFDSKEAIVVAVIDDIFLQFTDVVEDIIATVDDPVEKVAVALSTLLRLVVLDPLRSKFLLRAELFNESIGNESRQRLVRDLSDGLKQGLFDFADMTTASHMVTGMYFGYLRGRLVGQIEKDQEENTIFLVLRMLGAPEEKAKLLSKQYGSNS